MNRIFLAALAVGSVLLITESASAQYGRSPYGRSGYGCPSVRTYSYSTYRSYGPGTHISRYAVPSHSIRLNHGVTRSTHYRLPPTRSARVYHSHPHSHYHHPYRYGVRRSGVSLNIRF